MPEELFLERNGHIQLQERGRALRTKPSCGAAPGGASGSQRYQVPLMEGG